ncbi:hypothetical protein niasHT_012033 [Heterodera trifolii]|uniref:Uncharacterized protein n=1 Tax=Heterodera trifolii TaxID=157864 RepID=A0ABD2KVM4_9BILA
MYFEEIVLLILDVFFFLLLLSELGFFGQNNNNNNNEDFDGNGGENQIAGANGDGDGAANDDGDGAANADGDGPANADGDGAANADGDGGANGAENDGSDEDAGGPPTHHTPIFIDTDDHFTGIVGACGESCYKVSMPIKSDGAELVSMHSELEREFVNVVALTAAKKYECNAKVQRPVYVDNSNGGEYNKENENCMLIGQWPREGKQYLNLHSAVYKYGMDVLWRDEVCETPESVDKVMSKQKQMYGDGSNHMLCKFSGTLVGCGDYCKTGY